MADNSIFVVTAHVGDFVWRCGGAIALHARQGIPVHLVCLSYGENGESNSAWVSAPQSDTSAVKQKRHAEAEKAADILGVKTLDFYDLGDYPLPHSRETIERLARTMRAVKPRVVITHPAKDPSNLDHCRAFDMTLDARMHAMAPGHGPDFISTPQILSFEPHQPEICDFKPSILLDITSVWDAKAQAMQAMATQKNLWAYYERVALQRGAQAGRRSQTTSVYGEAYQALFPLNLTTFF